MVRIDAIPASDDDLALAHSETHIDKVRETINDSKTVKGKLYEMKKGQNTKRFKNDTYENKYTA